MGTAHRQKVREDRCAGRGIGAERTKTMNTIFKTKLDPKDEPAIRQLESKLDESEVLIFVKAEDPRIMKKDELELFLANNLKPIKWYEFYHQLEQRNYVDHAPGERKFQQRTSELVGERILLDNAGRVANSDTPPSHLHIRKVDARNELLKYLP